MSSLSFERRPEFLGQIPNAEAYLCSAKLVTNELMKVMTRLGDDSTAVPDALKDAYAEACVDIDEFGPKSPQKIGLKTLRTKIAMRAGEGKEDPSQTAYGDANYRHAIRQSRRAIGLFIASIEPSEEKRRDLNVIHDGLSLLRLYLEVKHPAAVERITGSKKAPVKA